MPIILRVKGYRIRFYEADLDEPVHVHIEKENKTAKYWLSPIMVARQVVFARMNSQKSNEFWENIATKFCGFGNRSKQNVQTVKAQVKASSSEYTPIVPIVIPDLREVRQFANQLHQLGEVWAGEFQGWQAEYHPERAEAPLDSRMTFTPAEFCIGESDIWFFSMMWEHGNDQLPVEFLDDASILALAA